MTNPPAGGYSGNPPDATGPYGQPPSGATPANQGPPPGYPAPYNQGPPPGGYPGNMPAAPQYGQGGYPPAQLGPRPTPPSTVQGAFYIYLALALLAVLNIILVITSSDLQKAIDSSGADTGGVDVSTLVTAVKVTTIVIGILILALYVFFAIKMRNGRNWARIVLTVLSVLSLLSRFSVSSSVTVNGQTYSATSGAVVGWVSAIAGIIAVVLMFLKPSNDYFNALKARRS